ncbi:hypothetical protein MCAMS1_00527 [biofilm metagenome]
MKLSNILTLPKANKLETSIKLDWLPANLPVLVSAAVIITTAVVVLQVRQQTKTPEIKSMAWYMANPQDALSTNKICYDNPQLKATDNCVNSLHALEIMHKGPNS